MRRRARTLQNDADFRGRSWSVWRETGWLSLHSSGRLTLSPRSLLELAPYLRETFSQGTQEDDDDTPEYERDRTVVDCNLCMTIVTSVSPQRRAKLDRLLRRDLQR